MSPSRENSMVVEALRYAQLGWYVFPVHEARADGSCSCPRLNCDSVGKHPYTPRGFLDATTAESHIRSWWNRRQSANIGIRTGAESRLVVLDVDLRHGGAESLARLENEHEPLPPTVETLTGGGGSHLYFGHPGIEVPNSAGSLRSGLDVRGDGGYLIAPPSRHVSGETYQLGEGRERGDF